MPKNWEDHRVKEYRFTCNRAGEHREETRESRKPQGIRRTSSNKCGCNWSITFLQLCKPQDIIRGPPEHLVNYQPGFYLSSYSKHRHNHNAGAQCNLFRDLGSNVPDPQECLQQVDSDPMWQQGQIYYDAALSQDVAFEKLQETHAATLVALQLTASKLYSKLRYRSRINLPHPGRDAFDFIKDLHDRSQNEDGFRYNYILEDGTSALEAVFYMTAAEINNMQVYGVDMCVMDTTHQTNFHDMYLALFVMENKHGDTVTGGKGFIAHQDTVNFCWLFQTLKQFTEVQPHALMTDGDAAIAAAIRLEYPMTRHLLCIWHIIMKNVPKNLAKYLSAADMKEVISALWAYALKDDLDSLDQMETEEGEIITFINIKHHQNVPATDLATDVIADAEIPTDGGVQCKVKWINRLFAKKDMWVRRCIINECFCRDIRTTQRVESINARVDQMTTRHTSLCTLGAHLRRYDDNQLIKRHEKEHIDTCKPIGYISSFKSVENIFENVLTRFAYNKQASELNESAEYSTRHVPGDGAITSMVTFDGDHTHNIPETLDGHARPRDSTSDGVTSEAIGTPEVADAAVFSWKQRLIRSRHVRILTNHGDVVSVSCSCGYPTYMGLLCRHVCAVAMKTDKLNKACLISLVHPGWAKASSMTSMTPHTFRHRQIADRMLQHSSFADYTGSALMLADEDALNRSYRRSFTDVCAKMWDTVSGDNLKCPALLSICQAIVTTTNGIEQFKTLADNIGALRRQNAADWSIMEGGEVITEVSSQQLIPVPAITNPVLGGRGQKSDHRKKKKQRKLNHNS